MLNIIKWFSILVLVSAVITIIQESFGIVTEPPDTANDLILFLQISLAPITEEIGFRLILIGIPLFLIYSHKSSIKFFIKSFFVIIGSRKVNNNNNRTLSSCNVKIKIYFIKFCS